MTGAASPWPGTAVPLGASCAADGTNFAVFSAAASAMTLCLFDDDGTEHRVPLTEVDSFIWHAFLPGVGQGHRYGYRADGPWSLTGGDRCSPAKLLLDPYGLAVEGDVRWGRGEADEPLFDRRWSDGSRSTLDSAALMPRSVVVDRNAYQWQEQGRPDRPPAETVVYECHVKGMTARHPAVPEAQRGTYAGLTHPAVIAHLRGLGVTAVELMPVHQFVSEQELVRQGRSDYWGYNTIGFFAPHNAYCSTGQRGQQVAEFKQMVQTFHDNDLEVLLDVVYNHTAEGGSQGPTFCFRGLDHRSYYLLKDDGETVNTTGTGNTLNIWDPAALRLVLDSLRSWVTDMHVDGFRFDLASILSATDGSRSVSVFLDLVAQDPVLANVKLIAEPWYAGPDGSGYSLGRFPPGWGQWNDQFRNCVRDTWRSAAGVTGRFRDVFEGTPTLFDAADGEAPSASVNYAASHDGMSLRDLVSFDADDQRAWDSRSPGDTDEVVAARRNTRVRAMLMTTLLAQGLPMLQHGDELGRTLHGNANAYDQDNEIAWVDWEAADTGLTAFTRRLVALRRAHPVFRQPRFRTEGGSPRGRRLGLDWFTPNGDPLPDPAPGGAVTVTVHLDGSVLAAFDPVGVRVVDDDFLLLVNAWWEPLAMTLPAHLAGPWTPVLDATTTDGVPADGMTAGVAVTVGPRSALLLRTVRAEVAHDDDG